MTCLLDIHPNTYQIQETHMNMPSGIALPADVAQQQLMRQMQQQVPSIEEQLRLSAVQIAIASYNVDGNTERLTNDSLIARAKAIEDYIAGRTVFEGEAKDTDAADPMVAEAYADHVVATAPVNEPVTVDYSLPRDEDAVL